MSPPEFINIITAIQAVFTVFLGRNEITKKIKFRGTTP